MANHEPAAPERERKPLRFAVAGFVCGAVLAGTTAGAIAVLVHRHDTIVSAQPLSFAGGFGGFLPTVDNQYGPGERMIPLVRPGCVIAALIDSPARAEHQPLPCHASRSRPLHTEVTPSLEMPLSGSPTDDGLHGPALAFPHTVPAGGLVTLVLTFQVARCDPHRSTPTGAVGTITDYDVRLHYRGATLDRSLPLAQPIVYDPGDPCRNP